MRESRPAEPRSQGADAASTPAISPSNRISGGNSIGAVAGTWAPTDLLKAGNSRVPIRTSRPATTRGIFKGTSRERAIRL